MRDIRYVRESDKNYWFKLDRHISEEEFSKKVRYKMGYVLFENNIPAGILRYNFFWDSIPFCTMLFIDNKFQQQGMGKQLMIHWEQEMKALGHGMLMTSTQVDETAQHFYRKLGYTDSGNLIINAPGYEQPMEMFFIKEI